MTHEPTPVGTEDGLPAAPEQARNPRPVPPARKPVPAPAPPPPPPPQPAPDGRLVSYWAWESVFWFGAGVGALATLAFMLFVVCLREGCWHEDQTKLQGELKQTAAKLAALEARNGKP